MDTAPITDQGARRRGLRVVEVVAVIVVLGILAAIVAFTVDDTNRLASTSVCTTEAKSIRTAIDSYRAKHHATENPPMSGPNSLVSDREMLAPSPHWRLSYAGHTPVLTAIPGTGCRN